MIKFLLLFFFITGILFSDNNITNNDLNITLNQEKYKKVFIINEYHDFIKELEKSKKDKKNKFKLYKGFYFFDGFNNTLNSLKKNNVKIIEELTETTDEGKKICFIDYIFNKDCNTCLMFKNFKIMEKDNFKLVSVILDFETEVNKDNLNNDYSLSFLRKRFLPIAILFDINNNKSLSNNIFNYEGDYNNRKNNLYEESNTIKNKIKNDFVYSEVFYEIENSESILKHKNIEEFVFSKDYNRKIQYLINFFENKKSNIFLIFSGNDYLLNLSIEFLKIIDIDENKIKNTEELFLENNI